MRGILLVNIGSPTSCSKADVKTFIGDILSDPLVTGKAEWWSKFLARNIIAPLSAASSVKKYQLVWRSEEPISSPQYYHMRRLAQALEEAKGLPVEVATRYGEPNFTTAVKELERRCPLLHEVIVFPLYPHYAQATTRTTIEEIGRLFYSRPHSFRLKFVKPYYDHPAFIHALAAKATPYLNKIDRLIFIYHSLPVAQVEAAWKKGKEYDYVFQSKETNRILCEKAGFDTKKTLLFYSSQRGNRWLKPFLNSDIGDLPRLGWKRVAVMSPGFPIDNLETLYDVNIEARKLFMNAGGEEFLFIPSLNDSEEWVEAIWEIVNS
jgi:ferrochelatase